jgi:hypothetical protein
MNVNELKQKVEELLKECPERKESAARAAESDTYNCYTWDDHSHIIKDYCYTQIDFYNLVAEGNAEKIAKYINGITEEYKNSFLRKIENVNEWY